MNTFSWAGLENPELQSLYGVISWQIPVEVHVLALDSPIAQHSKDL